MAETGAVFGGEHSGHYYFRDNYRADSGIITALLVLELMSKSDQPLSALLEPYRRYADSGEINTEVADPPGAVEAVAKHEEGAGANTDRLDGLTVDHGDWWYNLRPSNTEPLLRLTSKRQRRGVRAPRGRGARPGRRAHQLNAEAGSPPAKETPCHSTHC